MKRADTVLGSPVEVYTREMFTHILRKLSAFLAKSDFSISEVAALHLIGQGGRPSIQALGEQLNLSVSAASRLVSGLVDKGLVLRQPDPRDARAKVLTCTREGARLLDQMSLERVAAIFEVAETLPPAVSEQILNAIEQARKGT